MSSARDPQRWRDAGGAPSAWSAAVRADDAATPDAAALQRVLRGVAVELGRPDLTPQPSAATSGTVTPAALSPLVKLTATIVGLAAVATSVWFFAAGPSAAPPLSAAGPAGAPVRAHEDAPHLARPSGDANGARTSTGEPAQEVVASTDDKAAPVLVDTPRSVRPRAQSARASKTPAGEGDPTAELALLERAQRTLEGDPRAALALSEQHRSAFARGVFAQEREMLAIDALLRLGERARAERRARAFERSYPRSSHRARLADLLSSHP